MTKKDKKNKKDTSKILPKQGYPADLAPYLGKKLEIHLKGDRRVRGKVIGYDHSSTPDPSRGIASTV